MDGRDAARKRLIGQLRARVDEPSLSPASPTAGAERVTIRETADGLGIHVPAVKHVFAILFMLVWLAGWSAGEWFALSEIFSGGFGAPDIFLVFWVSLWSLGGLAAWSIVLWQIFGVDRLFVTAGALVKETSIGPFSRRQVWPLDTVRAFGRPGNGPHSRKELAGKGIAFEAGGRTRYFGGAMTEPEIEAVLTAIHRHIPRKAETGADTVAEGTA